MKKTKIFIILTLCICLITNWFGAQKCSAIETDGETTSMESENTYNDLMPILSYRVTSTGFIELQQGDTVSLDRCLSRNVAVTYQLPGDDGTDGVSLPVIWDTTGLNINAIGTYVITGTIITDECELPLDWENAPELTFQIRVIQHELMVLTLSNKASSYDIEDGLGYIELGYGSRYYPVTFDFEDSITLWCSVDNGSNWYDISGLSGITITGSGISWTNIPAELFSENEYVLIQVELPENETYDIYSYLYVLTIDNNGTEEEPEWVLMISMNSRGNRGGGNRFGNGTVPLPGLDEKDEEEDEEESSSIESEEAESVSKPEGLLGAMPPTTEYSEPTSSCDEVENEISSEPFKVPDFINDKVDEVETESAEIITEETGSASIELPSEIDTEDTYTIQPNTSIIETSTVDDYFTLEIDSTNNSGNSSTINIRFILIVSAILLGGVIAYIGLSGGIGLWKKKRK